MKVLSRHPAVIPAKAGIHRRWSSMFQGIQLARFTMDSRLRGNDGAVAPILSSFVLRLSSCKSASGVAP